VNRSHIPFLLAALVVAAGIGAAPLLFDRLDSSLDHASHTEAERTEADLVAITGNNGQLLALLEKPTADPEAVAEAIDTLPGTTATQVAPSPISPDTVLVIAEVAAGLDDHEREQLLADAMTIPLVLILFGLVLGGLRVASPSLSPWTPRSSGSFSSPLS
jgi:malonyl CoA-acyl carrier protein transacylase